MQDQKAESHATASNIAGNTAFETKESVSQAKLRQEITRRLDIVMGQHKDFTVDLRQCEVSGKRCSIRVRIEGPVDWNRAIETQDALIARITSSLEAKYKTPVHVSVDKGSLTLLVVFGAIEVAKMIAEVANSVHTIVEYVIRCSTQERWDWPPITAVFSILEAIKRIILGI